MSFLYAATALLVGISAASLVLWVVLRFAPTERTQATGTDESLSFLFENERLIDASDEAEELLARSGLDATWSGIAQLFEGRFALTRDSFRQPESDKLERYPARDSDDDQVLLVERSGETVRVELTGTPQSGAAEYHKLHMAQQEMKILNYANQAAPFPVWHVDANGDIAWFNPAYAELYQTIYKQPPQSNIPLFRLPESKLDPNKSRRVPVTPPNTRQTVWYDVRRLGTEIGDFYSAVDANAIVRAEAAQRNFVQTLAKTFAHVPIGLAIFDNNRQLVLFNPAVIDLTGLGADFLSARPNLLSFFDELRNKRLMPEPKNYNSWRQQIADLVAAAADGRYSETWTLDSGRTYRVNGRPHPDGAIAFLIEDISSEVSMTRRFRAELELGQSLIDHLDSAIAVFSSTGILTISNEAYRTLWSVDPDNTFAEVTIIDCLRDWQEVARPSPVWTDLRDFVLEFGERDSWSAKVALKTDQDLFVDAVPLVSGATMIRFVTATPMDADMMRPPKLEAETT